MKGSIKNYSLNCGGIIFYTKEEEKLVQDNMFIDQSYLSFDGYETISINRLLRSIPSGTGVHDIRNYSCCI